jgi:hypothetical protein
VARSTDQDVLVKYELETTSEPPVEDVNFAVAAGVVEGISIVLWIEARGSPPLQDFNVACGGGHVHGPADFERKTVGVVLPFPPLQDRDVVFGTGGFEGGFGIVDLMARVYPPVEDMDLAMPGSAVDGICNGAEGRARDEIGVVLKAVLPPVEDGDTTVFRRDDGDEILFEDGGEHLVVAGEQVVEDVDVLESDGEAGANLGGVVDGWIGGTDDGEVARDHGLVHDGRTGPFEGPGEGGGHTDSTGELPVADIVHDVGQNLDGEIGSAGGITVGVAGDESGSWVGGGLGIAETGLGRREVVEVDVVVGEAGGEVMVRARGGQVADFEEEEEL